MLIINADRYGESTQTNRGIVACFEAGVISGTSIYANMPGFEEAVELAHENGFVGQIGLHVNINTGFPLTNKIRYLSRFCNSNGEFSFQSSKKFYLNHEEQSALKDEVASQIEKCRSFGLPLNHADSHLNVHTELPVFHAIGPVLKFYGIRHVRIAPNMRNGNFREKVAQTLFNKLHRFRGFSGTDFLGDLEDFRSWDRKAELKEYLVEIMICPCVDDEGQVISKLNQQPLMEGLKGLIDTYEIRKYPLRQGVYQT